MDNDFWKTPLEINCIMPTDYDLDLRPCDKTYFSKCNLFVVLLPLNVYFFMLNCIHYVFTFIDFCTFYLLTYTVKVILKHFFFSLNSSQTFFSHVKFSGHLNVSFVHLFTGILYPKNIIAFRAFKCHLIFTCTLYLPNDIFHEIFLQRYGHLNAVFFTCISCFILTYRYVFVYKTVSYLPVRLCLFLQRIIRSILVL